MKFKDQNILIAFTIDAFIIYVLSFYTTIFWALTINIFLDYIVFKTFSRK